MMFKKPATLVALLLLFLFLSTLKSAEAEDKQVLLVYDRVNYFGQQLNQVDAFKELLASFPCSVKTIKQEDYRSGLEQNYDLIIYLALEGNKISTSLLEDLGSRKKSIFYLGKGIEQYLTAFPSPFIDYQGISSEITTITYQGKVFSLDYSRDLTTLQANGGVWYGQLSDGKDHWPYIYHWDNFWYGAVYDSSNTVLEAILKNVLAEILGLAPGQSPFIQSTKESFPSLQEARSSLKLGIQYFTLLLGAICLNFLLILTSSGSRMRKNFFGKES